MASKTRSRSLPDLFKKIPVKTLSPIPEVMIRGIALDSRKVEPGYVFFAIQGLQTDGHTYIPQAIANGAVAIIGNRTDYHGKITYITVEEDPRYVMANLAAAFYDFPARDLTMIGVTGTDGKTTTTMMIHHILQSTGVDTGMISTVSAVIGQESRDTGFHVTTPEAPDVQAYLAEMVEAGMTHAIIEATSHGLEQGRVIACDFDIAVITNITHEHLDFHGSYQAYQEAKGKLFADLKQTPKKAHGNIRTAILNKDDQSYAFLKRISPRDQITYSMLHKAHVWADEINNTAEMLSFRCHMGDLMVSVSTPMTGIYNVSNCLAALAACVLRLDVPLHKAAKALATMPGVPGRMEQINLGQDFTAMIDFAHTPNALYRALDTARQLTNGKVIAVFGSAGLRDKEKRQLMPEIAIENADLTILTAEDPRTEALDTILEEMAAAATATGGKEGKDFWRIPDRGNAIRFALDLAEAGDVIIICGKGHEQSMCFGTTEYAWDDRTALKAALSSYLGIPGPQMPYLPTSEV